MKLRNGAEVPQPTVMTTMLSLDALESRGMEGMIALWELYERAKDENYSVLPHAQEILTNIGLLREGGILHRDTADVILSSFEGNGADFRRVYPLA